MSVPFFPFLTLLLIFIIVSTVYRSYLDKKREEREEQFWTREEQAEHTPPVDLSTLSYIRMPAKGFHLAAEGDEAMAIEEEIMALSEKPLLNISGMTNTEVKLTYGTANFEKMQEIGENYDRLVILLADYAKILIEQDHIEEAVEVLEFGMEIGTDISSNYTLLGDCYERMNEEGKIRDLIGKVEEMNLLLKSKILGSLQKNLSALTAQEKENFEVEAEVEG